MLSVYKERMAMWLRTVSPHADNDALEVAARDTKGFFLLGSTHKLGNEYVYFMGIHEIHCCLFSCYCYRLIILQKHLAALRQRFFC